MRGAGTVCTFARADLRRAALAGLPLATAAVAAAFYAATSIFRHGRFGSSGYDLGIFDQTIWGYSRFEIVRNTVKGTPNLLGDHFHPILVLLAPAYWVWDDARVLLIVQALALAVASLPVFYWGRSKLGTAPALCAQAAFLAFWGLLAGVIFDFHELALAVPAISFGLRALLERRVRLFWSMLAVGCLTKEDVALTFAAMGLYALLIQRRMRFGSAVSAVAMSWFALVIGLVIPGISGRRYHYFDYPAFGRTWTGAFAELVERPYRAATVALDRREKAVTLVETFGSWLFLPLASPLVLVALPSLAERFWGQNPYLWSTGFQYSLPVAPVLAFAAIDAAGRLRGLGRPLIVAAAVCAVALTAFVVRPVTGMSGLMSARQAALSDACLDTIPANASVAASPHLIPHLTHRPDIRLLARQSGERYLAVAGRAFFVDRTLVAGVRNTGRATDPPDGAYRLVCRRGAVSVFEATSRPRSRGGRGGTSPVA